MQINDEQKEALKGLFTFAAIYLCVLILPIFVLIGLWLIFPELD